MTCTTNDMGDGRYEISWVGEKSGSYALHITCAGAEVFGSPTQITLRAAGPEVNNCEVAGTGLRLAMAGCHAYLHIHCRDRFSNPTERRDYPMDFGMIIIPEELYIADSMQKAAMEQQQLEESRQQEKKQGKGRMSKEVVVEKQRTYSDDEIYGLSSSRAKRRMTEAQEAEAKAKAEAKAAKKAAAGAPSAEAFVPLWKRGASAGLQRPQHQLRRRRHRSQTAA